MINNHAKVPQKNDFFVSFLVTVVLPVIILMKLSGDEQLGAWPAFALALSLPIIYFLINLVKQGGVHWLALCGFINVLLTGGLGALQLEGIWFAAKEAAIPLIIGVVILVLRYKTTLIQQLFLHSTLFNVELITQSIASRNCHQAFAKLVSQVSYVLASSFFVSSVLNFILAYMILQSPVGTSEFNQELAYMQLLSYPVIVLPSLLIATISIFWLIRGITHLTGYKFQDLLAENSKD
ncbi:MAG: MFS transporter [Proteobacteria bacterium]|nr:MFS transporter [Pseudomonadota bacterium]